jgi:nitrogen-specific signal transduction histidine kinase
LHDAQGNVIKFVGTTTDIDEQKRVEESLAELDRAKTTFFSNVSHEFRTPLTLMLGPLEEVLAHERLESEGHELLATVRRNDLRLLKLVNALLDFSRMEAGRAQTSYQPTDLASFTSEIASAFDSAMKNAGLRFLVECLPIADPVYVDRDMWEKIVLNLLSNAYKFTFEGEVALTLKSVDGAVELRIRDTGVGIPEEHREHVFERFHRIESTHARTYEGTGIGLALVEELVRLHGGTVRVDSAVGAGSTFTATIPRGKEHLPAGRIHAPQTLVSTTIRAEAYVEELKQWLGNEPGLAVDAATLPKQAPLAPRLESSPPGKRELIVYIAIRNRPSARMHCTFERGTTLLTDAEQSGAFFNQSKAASGTCPAEHWKTHRRHSTSRAPGVGTQQCALVAGTDQFYSGRVEGRRRHGWRARPGYARLRLVFQRR